MKLGYLKCSCGAAVAVIDRDAHCLSCGSIATRAVAEFAIRMTALERDQVIDRCGIHAGPDNRLVFLFSQSKRTVTDFQLHQ